MSEFNFITLLVILLSVLVLFFLGLAAFFLNKITGIFTEALTLLKGGGKNSV